MPNPSLDSVVRDLVGLYTLLVQSLVDDEDAVRIEPVVTGKEVCLRLTVASGDIGKVIGKQGRHARSLRVLLGAAGLKYKMTFALDILE